MFQTVFTVRNSPLRLTGSAGIVIMSNSNLRALQHIILPCQITENTTSSKLICTLHTMIVPGSKRTDCLNSTPYIVFHVEFLKRTIFGLCLGGCTVYSMIVLQERLLCL